ncbi:glycoside hydrolase family 104 protein [Flavobacterium sp.]|uniref:glycoside hydrolase family 24 protein n=1 Tax=Flavobacterium sp. TaxID=239 RepID=UPI00374CF55C
MSNFKIIGPENPEIGKEIIYKTSISNFPASLPGQINPVATNPFTEQVKWSIYILEYGKWILKEKNNKTGPTANYTFTAVSLKRKGIRIVALLGNEKATLDIKPLDTIERKIVKVELCDALGNLQTKPFAYSQTVLARVHCLNLDNCAVHVTLWEDDAPGAGHNEINKNNKAITKSELVSNGIADVKFKLAPDFAKMADAQLAKGDKSEGKTHEYYVTAEIFRQETKSSNNINVTNPNNKTADTKAKATPQKPVTKPVAAKPTPPAAKKGQSKKEEKGVPKTDSGTIYDWAESMLKAMPTILPDPIEIVNSLAKLFTPDKKEEKKGEKNSVCECEARVRAFMRMLRKGEGTQGESGYTKQFGGGSFSDMSNHPQEIIHSGNYYSSAAGAYQIMGYTYYWLNGEKLNSKNKKAGVYEKDHDYIKRYNIKDFKNESQDKLCLIILKHKRKGSIDLIIKNEIKEALEKYGSYEWASLPPGRYGQPTQTMDGALKEYDRCLKEELAGKTNLYLQKGFLKEFGYNCCSDSKSDDSANCKSCKKIHIDLTDKVKWQSQYDSKWGNKLAQDKACKKTCDDILIKNGLKATSLSRLFQTAIENDAHTKLIVDTGVSKKGVEYLDSELEKGNPVQVGVDHDLNYKINNNADHSTDHFIVIIGRGCDEGKIYYSFYDVGTSFEKKGASDSNRLYLDISDNSLKGKTVYNGNFYTVTQIRKN